MTPYPPSFGSNPILYAWALGGITTIAILMLMILGWMARDIWRDRHYCHPKEPLFMFRAILFFASMTGFMRATPEAVYMYAWNEVTSQQWDLILTVKRVADGFSAAPGTIWPILLTLAYPSLAHTLKAGGGFAPLDILSPWSRLIRPALALVLIFIIAFLVAFSKLYLGGLHR